jgi:hypothetical protein
MILKIGLQMLNLLNSLLLKAEKSSFNLFILNLILYMAIPFNKKHRIHIRKISAERILTAIPYKRKNFNHIRGIHACAIATLSEFVAGLELIRRFPPREYRLIMSKLEIEYFYQAKTNLIAFAEIPQNTDEITSDQNNIKYIKVKSIVNDINNNHIADCFTTWQLKSWKDVKTKV